MERCVYLLASCRTPREHLKCTFQFLVRRDDIYDLMFHTIRVLGNCGFNDIEVNYSQEEFDVDQSIDLFDKDSIEKCLKDRFNIVPETPAERKKRFYNGGK